jgi:hypothetical protein
MMKSMPIDKQLSAQDRYGRRLAARLDLSAQHLPHDISERLRVARLQAMDKYRPSQALAAAPLVMAGGVSALGGGDDENRLWPRLVSLIPLLALVAGLIALQVLGSDSFTEELAEIDAALLTDDLPPDAYADPGFAQFLKSRLDSLQKD